MRLTIIGLMILFIGNFAVAGGSQGGTLKTGNGQGTMRVIDKDQIKQATQGTDIFEDFARIKNDPTIRIIHGAPSLNGVSRISVGRINQNQWQVKTIDIPDDLLIKSDLSQEIQKSIELNDWVEIQSTNP